jgi:hypothetical protein
LTGAVVTLWALLAELSWWFWLERNSDRDIIYIYIYIYIFYLGRFVMRYF